MGNRPFFRSMTGKVINKDYVMSAAASPKGFASYGYDYKFIEKVSAKRMDPYKLLDHYVENIVVTKGLHISGVGFVTDCGYIQKVVRNGDGVYVVDVRGYALFELPATRFRLLERLEKELNDALLGITLSTTKVEFDTYDFLIRGGAR